MTLRHIETQVPWVPAEPINGVRYPRSIASSWSATQLKRIGLEKTPPPEPQPAPRRTVGDFREFMDLFTPGEQIAIVTAAKSNVALELWLLRGQGGPVPLDHPDTIEGIGTLLSGGLITQEAHDAVLAADYNDGKTNRTDPA